jgi:hypothetical protein
MGNKNVMGACAYILIAGVYICDVSLAASFYLPALTLVLSIYVQRKMLARRYFPLSKI